MNDWTSHYKQCESAAMGEALIQLLAKTYNCEPSESAIKSGVYKGTYCGAWIAFTETGVKVGSIVEGSDAETTSYDIPYNGEDEAFLKAYWEALGEVEDEAQQLWEEAHA